jgi:hypothetical protein
VICDEPPDDHVNAVMCVCVCVCVCVPSLRSAAMNLEHAVVFYGADTLGVYFSFVTFMETFEKAVCTFTAAIFCCHHYNIDSTTTALIPLQLHNNFCYFYFYDDYYACYFYCFEYTDICLHATSCVFLLCCNKCSHVIYIYI